jgi:hypothetical protein
MQSINTKKFFLFHTIPTRLIANKINEKFNNIIKGTCLTFKRKITINFIN